MRIIMHFVASCFVICMSIMLCASLPTGRISIAHHVHEYNIQEPEGPGTYSYGYDIEDSDTGNIQFRSEDRAANGTVSGSYGYVTPEGNVHMVHYTADHLGYRARIEDGSVSALRNDLYRSDVPPYHTMSPEMVTALLSLQYYKPQHQQFEDQYVRPVDRFSNNRNSPNIEEYPTEYTSQYYNNIPNDYNSYYVPNYN